MTHAEIKESLALFQRLHEQREDILWENEGEETEEVIDLEEQKLAIARLLNTDGTDALGRWMMTVQSQADAYDLEIKKLQNLKKNCKNTQDYIKQLMGQILRTTLDGDGNPINETRGTLYRFKASTSVTNTIDKERLNEDFMDLVNLRLRGYLPLGIEVELKLTTTAAKDNDDLKDYIITKTEETSTFYKPKKK